jgi:hypothetical protein
MLLSNSFKFFLAFNSGEVKSLLSWDDPTRLIFEERATWIKDFSRRLWSTLKIGVVTPD